jgi:hypothetical protein
MSSLIVIDWDDTLFPTSWIKDTELDMDSCNSTIKDILSALDDKICNMISRLHENGDIIIINMNLIYGKI